jgi:hypothetical protein
LAARLPELEADPYRRGDNGTVAICLLHWFLDDPSLWRDCGTLNCWDPYADATFRDYLDSWDRGLRRAGSTPRVPQLIDSLLFRPPAPDDNANNADSAGSAAP